MRVPRIIGRDGLCALDIVVDFLAVEQREDAFSSGVHEVLIDIVHAVINDDVTDASALVAVELLLLVQQILVYLIVEAVLLVLVLEETAQNYRTRLRTVHYFQYDRQNGEPA